MDNNPQSRPAKPISWMRRAVSYILVLLVGVLIGFVPMWVKARASTSDLSDAASRADILGAQTALASAEAAHQLDLATLQITLASATIDVQRGDYDSARQYASSFFTALRAEVDKGDDSGLSQAQREAVQPLFAQQDEVITLLARNEPSAAGRFSDLYVTFRDVISQ